VLRLTELKLEKQRPQRFDNPSMLAGGSHRFRLVKQNPTPADVNVVNM
jgi:hypothetical protein